LKSVNLSECFTIAAIVVVVVLVLLGTAACSSKPYAQVKQGALAVDAGIKSTLDLGPNAGIISPNDARPIYEAGRGLQASLVTWKTDLDGGDKGAAAIAAGAVQSGLTEFSRQLVQLQTRKNLVLYRDAGSRQLQLQRLRALQLQFAVTGNRKKLGEVEAAIAIIQLAADLAPQIVDWINTVSAKTDVSSADVQLILDQLAGDLNSLQAFVAAIPPATAPS
jgi:hypothetical protein